MPSSTRRRFLAHASVLLAASGAGCASSSGERTTTATRRQSSQRSDSTTREPRPLESCPDTTDSAPDDWPTFCYDAGNTSHRPDGTGPRSEAREQWRFEVADPVECAPTVASDTVYVTSRDRRVYAIDAASGDERWSFETGIASTGNPDTTVSTEPARSSPTVVDGTVYVAGGNYELRREDATIERVGTHVFLYALDAETGDELWRFALDAVAETTPTVVGNVAYVATTAGTVYAVDTTDGTVRWRFRVAGEATDGVKGTPAVADCTVFVGSESGTLYALDARDGTVEWRWDAGAPLTAAPAVHDGTVYVGRNGDSGVAALSSTDGDLLWEHPTNGSVVASSPAVAGDTVVVGCYTQTGKNLQAFDAADGERLWTGYVPQSVWTSPAVVDGTVYVADLDGVVYGFDASDGSERWRYETDSLIRSSPAVVDGSIYVGDDDGTVRALAEP